MESRLGEGTTFRIIFPRFEVSTGDAPLIVDPPAVTASHEVILLVEDETAVRELVTRVLNNDGYIVLAAQDGVQALALLGDPARPINLVLTDVVLPGGVQGDVLAEKASASRPGLPVLLMSGHPRHLVSGEHALDAGVNYPQKPFAPSLLLTKVREVLDAAAGR